MQITALSRALIQLVFSLSSGSTALTRPRLAQRLGVCASELNPAFEELARLGLLDPQRLRLTLPGLAVAAACAAKRPARKRARAPQARVIAAPIALFSQREAPRAVA